MAAGANGCAVEPDDCGFPNLQTCLSPPAFASFARAIQNRWFTDPETGKYLETFGLFGIDDIEKWTNYDTLADAIIAERKRLDAVKRQTNGKGPNA